jgi:hypothetical protein
MSNLATLPVAIPGDSSAPLPQRYEAARAAIAECDRIDDCKDWADKAAAMATYARQMNDDSLAVMARRIQARATRRYGELLEQIPRADEATRYGKVAAVPPVTRTQMATDAGLSERQRKTALRIANVPEATFDAQVESPRPPSITQLANLGKVTREPSGPRSPWEAIECADTREACETLERFAKYCEGSASEGIGRAVNATEAQEIRRLIAIADKWLDRLSANLAAEA